MEAITAARAEGLEHFLVEEGYRSWETQNSYFQKRMEKLSTKYSGDALIAATKKEVNYPGTSEFNSGLAFTLRLYDKKDPEVAKPKYSSTDQAKWMNRNCWKYGLVFRFPLSAWPLDETQDKSFKTGVSVSLNLYRYVGKGNAAVMHYFDFCLEEYIEYLQEHPHIAVFEDGVLKYEIYRQYVGEADSFNVQLTRNARSYSSSLDNMGAVVTVFEY
jgi:D-alanyl-D-alanine carboxypeptidase